MATKSAGLLMYRIKDSELQFLLIHPGGPFYKNKDEGVWSIPKGIPDDDENLLLAAQREFREETGLTPYEPFFALGEAKTRSGKTMHIWAFEGAWDENQGIVSNTFLMEWPPRSGKKIEVPEADRACWMDYNEASRLINAQQKIFLDRLVALRRL